jgi:hypothetical protein
VPNIEKLLIYGGINTVKRWINAIAGSSIFILSFSQFVH